MKLKYSREELNRAKKIVEKIKKSDSLKVRGQGKFKNLRKKDPLLRYLKNARDADVHSIQEITQRSNSSVSGKFVNPTGGYIEKMVIKNGVVEEYKGDPMIFEFSPGSVKAKSFFNNKQCFDIPKYHRGEKVKNQIIL